MQTYVCMHLRINSRELYEIIDKPKLLLYLNTYLK
jgi:hypothetical protein